MKWITEEIRDEVVDVLIYLFNQREAPLLLQVEKEDLPQLKKYV